MTPVPECGVIGLGAMGAPMALNLARAGLLAAVWNRTAEKAAPFALLPGVHIAATLAELAEHAAFIVLSVSADRDVLAVIDALVPALDERHVVIDTSTVSPDTARVAARRVMAEGAVFLDAPVSGGVEGARAGTLSMMTGGDEAVLERARPVLEKLAARIVHFGAAGAGQSAKAVNQVMAAGINQAVSEALAFAQALGLPLDRVIEALGAGAAASWFLAHRGPAMAAGRYPPGFRVRLHDKDLALCQELAKDLGARLPLVEMTRVHYRRLIAAGFGDEDISALHREKRGLFGD